MIWTMTEEMWVEEVSQDLFLQDSRFHPFFIGFSFRLTLEKEY